MLMLRTLNLLLRTLILLKCTCDKYLAVAPVFGAPDESRDDLRHTALGAFMGIRNQTLHMRLQQGQEGIIKVPEKALLQHKTFL